MRAPAFTMVLALVLALAVSGCGLFGGSSESEETPAPTSTPVPSETPAAPTPAEPPAAPAPTETAAPATGGDPCSAYQACCDAVSQMPNMGAMAAGCSNIEQLRGMPTAGPACTQARDALRQAMAAMPGGAPAACN
jgi:hypothetical protein